MLGLEIVQNLMKIGLNRKPGVIHKASSFMLSC